MIQTIHERSNAIQVRAYRLTRGTTCKTAITMQKMGNQLGSVSNTTERMELDLSEIKLGVKTTEVITIESGSDIKQIKSELAKKDKKDEEAYKSSETALSNLKDMMQNQAKTAKCTSSILTSI